MKEIICLFAFFIGLLNSLPAQSKDSEARYAYAEAEKAFNEFKYEESIRHCDDAASSLGSINSKILYLKLKCFEKLVEQDCTNTISKMDTSIVQSIKLFFDITNTSTYSQDKYFEIVELKKKYENIKANGCPRTLTIKSANDEIDVNDEINSIYDSRLKIISLEDTLIDFSNYKGKKILIVITPFEVFDSKDKKQLRDLENLYQKYKDKLVVVGFPSIDYYRSSLYSDEQVKKYLRKRQGITFPVSLKIHTEEKNFVFKGKLTNKPNQLYEKGNDSKRANPHLFLYLASEAEKMRLELPAYYTRDFSKFLLDESGNLMAFFDYEVDPLSEELVEYLNKN